MTTSAEELPLVTFEDFLAGEQLSERRHELVGGRVYVMAGGSERHDLMAGLVYEAVAPGARAADCRPFTGNRLVRLGSAAYYPDVTVVCGPAGHRLHEVDLALVVEVLSPSTADTDRREKAAAYASAPGLRQYVLVDPDRPRIEVAVRVRGDLRWQAFGPGGVVVTDFGVLDVDALYDAVERTATT
ncbi:MAG: Uma2 family endonuclease [Actinomycetota bacterium]|nr:Uma2 family endonuclease [Actinomycetota bacterium]